MSGRLSFPCFSFSRWVMKASIIIAWDKGITRRPERIERSRLLKLFGRPTGIFVWVVLESLQ